MLHFRLKSILIFCLAVICIVISGICILKYSPYHNLDIFRKRPYSEIIYDRNGNILQIRPLENGLRREYRTLENIPPWLVKLIVQTEDKRFYTHRGIDVLSIVRALMHNLQNRKISSGASTITMQLARIITPYKLNNRYGKKLLEMYDALRLEMRLDKNLILELYLNNIPFGSNTEGAAAAARTFFAMDIGALSPAQMEILSKIPARPASYNEPAKYKYPYEAPHFINYIQSTQEKNNYQTHTTLDLRLQHYAEYLLASNVIKYKENRITNGAAIVLDNLTGGILAWVGSSDFFDYTAKGQIDGVLARNQAGSSMKPFLYALALENGYRRNNILPDVRTEFITADGEQYIPQNFNNRFNGDIPFSTALASSLNIPAVYLLEKLSVQKYVDFLLQAGFNLPADTAERAGLSLALGSEGVSLLELARGFSIFYNDGLLIDVHYFDLFDIKKGEENNLHRIIQSETAKEIISILSDKNERVLGFGDAEVFDTPFPAIFKTGTANQFQSITALASTRRFTAAVWMGNFTGETIRGKTGSSVPAHIARSILEYLEN